MNKLFNKWFRDADVDLDDLPSHKEAELVCVVVQFLKFDETFSHLDLNDTHELMNHFYSTTAEIIMRSGGSIDHFFQQFIMCFYGIHRQQIISDHQIIAAAREIVDSMERYKPQPKVGVGICFGKVILGRFGSEARAIFTGFGPAVSCARNISAQGSGVYVCEQLQKRVLRPFPRPELISVVKHTPSLSSD
ncbi:MAG TPA: adenylate/guanylate cyclase domain-containing protein [Candidatus Binatia bacterium]|jgi:class 3 adenylate cyclase